MNSENTAIPVEDRILAFIAAVEGALPTLQQQTEAPVTSRDIEVALVDRLGLEQSIDLLDGEWTSSRVIEALKSYDFRRLRAETLEQIQLTHSIVPDGVLRLLTEERIKQAGEIWVIHKNDADPFPSNPHAHNYSTGHKLHIGTGELFIRRKRVGRICTKDLRKLRTKIKHRPLPPLEDE